jgi:hypothetical protein
MLRPKPLATVIAALALLAGALFFTPIAATQSGQPTLSPTPPVKLLPPSTTTTGTTTTGTTTTGTTTSGPPPVQLPKTGLDAWLVALVGVGFVLAGEALRRAVAATASRARLAAAAARARE